MLWLWARDRQEWRQRQPQRNMVPRFASLTIMQDRVVRFGEVAMAIMIIGSLHTKLLSRRPVSTCAENPAWWRIQPPMF
jgi:hypothetical protein